MGDHVTKIEDNSPVAILASADTLWPNTPPRERGYKFIGYDLDSQGRPSFKYRAETVSVVDFLEPIAAGEEGTFRRKLTLSAETPVEGLYIRAAAGSSIDIGPDGTYIVDKLWTVKPIGGTASVRDSNGRKELLVPVTLQDGKSEVTLELKW